MTARRKLAFVAFALADVAMFAAGIVYLTAGGALPYHEQALGQRWEELPARFQALYLTSLKAIAVPTLVLAAALLALLLVPWRRGERWALIAVPAIALGYSLPMLAITLAVRAETGAATPWLPLAIGSLLVGFATLLSRPDHSD